MLLKENAKPYKVKGNYVCFDGDELVCRKGILKIENGIIADILPYDTTCEDAVVIDDNDVIFPGMMDLHTHHTYNMIPLWDSHEGRDAWDNRFEWRNCDDYKTNIVKPKNALYNVWHVNISEKTDVRVGDLLLYFAELQAVAGGVTVLQEPSQINVNTKANDTDNISAANNEFEPEFTYPWFERMDGWEKKAHLLLRSTGISSELGIENSDNNSAIASVVDLYAPESVPKNVEHHINTSDWVVTEKKSSADLLIDALKKISEGNTETNGYIVHLAEGRAGNLCPDSQTTDAYSKNEFRCFMDKINKIKSDNKITTENIKSLHINLIHGCAIDLNNKTEQNFLSENGIGLIWSPVSNLLLYADTPDFYKYAFSAGITMALGSDWSPSGSKHVWDECKFANKFLQSKQSSDKSKIKKDVFRMTTKNAAKIIGSKKLGNIQKGLFADFFILHGTNKVDCDIEKALDIFYGNSDDKMQLVVIAGNPIYGEEEYVEKIVGAVKNYSLIPTVDEYLKNKMVYLPEEWKLNLEEAMKAVDDSLGEIKRTQFRSSEDTPYIDRMIKLENSFVKNEFDVVVDAKTVWNDTGIDINGYADVKYISGTCKVSPYSNICTAEGNHITAKSGYLSKGSPEGCLVGKIGNGEAFFIGKESVIKDVFGRLYLGVNDDVNGKYGAGYTDNEGSFKVKVIKKETKI